MDASFKIGSVYTERCGGSITVCVERVELITSKLCYNKDTTNTTFW